VVRKITSDVQIDIIYTCGKAVPNYVTELEMAWSGSNVDTWHYPIYNVPKTQKYRTIHVWL
jgi:hypothetical protein